MQNLKTDSLKKYNELLEKAIKSSEELPDNLTQFVVDELNLEAAVLFEIKENKLSVIGKSSSAKSIYTKQSIFICPACLERTGEKGVGIIESHPDCKIPVTDFIMPEIGIYFNSNFGTYLLRGANKTEFHKNDKENLLTAGSTASKLIAVWKANEKPADANVGEVISQIGHELRTPLNSIIGFASLLGEEELTPSQTESVTTLKESALNLLSLINDLIEISKLEEGNYDETYSAINSRSLVNEIVNNLKDKIDRNSLSFIINFDENLPEKIKSNSQKLRFILTTLLTFSLRFTGQGKVSILISQGASDKINFRISDTSNGLTSGKLKEIYSPSIVSTLKNNQIGNLSGLGLLLCKKYLESLNGNLDITSTFGKGITYNFSIGAETVPEIETQLSSLPKPDKKNNVLVIEDDYATSKLLSNYLTKWGYQPLVVNSGKQALGEIAKDNFLAVLMDISLPDVNGFELLKTIREHKNTKSTPVIVCSVKTEQQKAFLMGAVEYFVKPIKYNFLVEVLTSYKLKKDSNILVVDDDIPTLNLIKNAVTQLGFNAIAESNSTKVSNLIKDMKLDLAIIDLDMPGLNGYDLIKQIKSNPKFVKLPVVIYTGKENYKEDLNKIDGLFEELLEKSSVNIEDLSETINAMINRYDEPSSPAELINKTDVVKILLVEDYKHSQIIVTRLLKKNGYENIVVVENGAEALDEVKKQKYQLILMDMQMPVMNGFEATEKIRQLSNYKETPIIALTAFAMKGDRDKCIEAGATDYIPKPIDSQEFIEKVKYYTERKEKAV